MAKLPDYHPETQLRIEPPIGRSKAFRIRYRSPDTQNKWTQLKLPEIDIANNLMKTGAVSVEHTREKFKLLLEAQYAHRDRTKTKAVKVQTSPDVVIEVEGDWVVIKVKKKDLSRKLLAELI